MEELLRVGVITSPHGVRGEVKVFPTTDDVNRFKKLKSVLLDTGKEKTALEIEHVKFFKNMVILKFKGFNNMNDVEAWRQKDLLIDRKQAVKLSPDENFIVDLIGLKVITDNGETLGTMTDVIQTGANDVYCVSSPPERRSCFRPSRTVSLRSIWKITRCLFTSLTVCLTFNPNSEQRRLL